MRLLSCLKRKKNEEKEKIKKDVELFFSTDLSCCSLYFVTDFVQKQIMVFFSKTRPQALKINV
jgi:hypothetical protein